MRLNSYMLRNLLVSTAVTAISLSAILWLTQAMRFIDYIVNNGIALDIFVLLTLLVLPSLLLMVLPVSVFTAVLFVYHRLRQDSELTAMEAAGASIWQRVRPALLAAGAAACVGYVVSLFLMPYCYREFREWQNVIRNNYASVLLQEGVFSTPVRGLTVFVRERQSDGVLKGILVHDNREAGMAVTMMAEQGKLVDGPRGQRFELEHGNRQELRGGKLSLLNFDAYALDLSFATGASGKREAELAEIYLPELLRTEGLSAQEITRRRGEAHQRILWPAYCVTLALMALAALLTGDFNRRGQVKRILLASGAGAGLMAVAIALRGVAGTHAGYTLLTYASAVLPALASVWLLAGRPLLTLHYGKLKTTPQNA